MSSQTGDNRQPATSNQQPATNLLILLCLIVTINSCGYYSFSGSNLPGIENIYVPIFGNSTTEFGLEQQLTDALVTAVNAERNLNIAERDNADAILEGRITAFSDGLLTYTGDEQVTEYNVKITVKVRFENVKDRKTILDDTFTATHNYDSDSPTEREKAIQTVLKKLSEDIINKAFSGW